MTSVTAGTSEAAVTELSAAGAGDDSALLAYMRLREQILTGELAPGTVLSQVRLARDFGISRTPLREAVRRLVEERLVVGDFNRRMRVSELHLDDFDQIYAMRIALEPVGIAATVPVLDAPALADLAAHVDQMDAAIDRLHLKRFRSEHRAFHLALTSAAGPRIEKTLADLWDHSERYRLTYLQHDYAAPDSASAERLRTSQVEHRAILAGALDADVATCAGALVAHLQRTVDVVFAEAARPVQPRLGDRAARWTIERWTTARAAQPGVVSGSATDVDG